MEENGARLNRSRLVSAYLLARSLAVRSGPETLVRSHVGRRAGAVLATVTRVVEEAGAPIRMSAVHAAVERLLGEVVPRSTVNEALSTHSRGRHPRFRRVRRGVYTVASDVG